MKMDKKRCPEQRRLPPDVSVGIDRTYSIYINHDAVGNLISDFFLFFVQFYPYNKKKMNYNAVIRRSNTTGNHELEKNKTQCHKETAF